MNTDISKEQAALAEIETILIEASEDVNKALYALSRLKGYADQLIAITNEVVAKTNAAGEIIDKTNRRTDASLGTSAR